MKNRATYTGMKKTELRTSKDIMEMMYKNLYRSKIQV